MVRTTNEGEIMSQRTLNKLFAVSLYAMAATNLYSAHHADDLKLPKDARIEMVNRRAQDAILASIVGSYILARKEKD